MWYFKKKSIFLIFQDKTGKRMRSIETKDIQTLHKRLCPYNPDINNVPQHELIPFTREQMSQTKDAMEDRDIDAVINILSQT